MVCELKEPVQPQKLQEALDQTMDFFPGFQTFLKRGLFWYYLEHTDLQPVVRQEYRAPCAQMYDREVPSLLFEVTYFQRCINLEVFHAISDGTGAMHFLRVLVFRYLKLIHAAELAHLPELDYDASESQSMDDSFEHYANRQKHPKISKVKTAFRLRGTKTPNNRLSVTIGTVPAGALLQVSRQYGTSLTILLCALVMQAVHEEMAVRDERKPVVLAVPINLRNHFNSASARNFFGVMDVSYDFSQGSGTLEDLIAKLSERFHAGLSPAELQFRVNQYIALIENPFARVTPLFFKDLGMRLGNHLVSKRETSAVSNVGIVRMPEELQAYIEKLEVFVSTEKVQLCALTYAEKMTLSFSSAFLNADLQRHFFRSLTALHIPVEIDTNDLEG